MAVFALLVVSFDAGFGGESGARGSVLALLFIPVYARRTLKGWTLETPARCLFSQRVFLIYEESLFEYAGIFVPQIDIS